MTWDPDRDLLTVERMEQLVGRTTLRGDMLRLTVQARRLRLALLCGLYGHDWRVVPDTRPRERLPSGRVKLRKPPSRCERCGTIHA